MTVQTKSRSSRPARRAFTLLEMMLVVVIMGVLATVAVVSLSGRGDAAKRGATFASLNTVQSSIQQFHLEKNRYPSSLSELVPKYISKTPKDGWKREFIYVSPSPDGRPYDCYSMGSDGQIGGGDDISIWDEDTGD
ncbi:MAG: type II secretion system protein GspG [Phycisphaeraceae bacterium]|nr:type II secretion system protein GspG [Phycisphaeraceae bacterium]